MKITRDNYEVFFLDYLEGKLEETKIDEFLDFLETNPDLKEELSLFEQFELPGEPVVFTGKEQLYKPVAEEKVAFEIKSVALMEGDLKGQERELFEAYLASDPELQKDYALMVKARLMADSTIKYPYKKNLYKKPGTLIWLNWVQVLGGVAAVLLIFWGIQSFFQTGSQKGVSTSNPQMASVKPHAEVGKKKVEPTNKIQATATEEKLPRKEELVTPASQSPPYEKTPTIASETTNAVERDLSKLEEINPLLAQLEPDPIENQLADWNAVNAKEPGDTRNVMTLDEFVVNRAKKAGGKGLLSANRILRLGLNVASELSGDRIGYKEKDGKISSLDVDTRLMAFSIPLQKK